MKDNMWPLGHNSKKIFESGTLDDVTYPYHIIYQGFRPCLFVCFDSLHPSQQFFSHDRTGLPGLNQVQY